MRATVRRVYQFVRAFCAYIRSAQTGSSFGCRSIPNGVRASCTFCPKFD